MKNIECEKEKIEKLLKGSKSVVIATEKGSACIGREIDLLTLFGIITSSLIETGMDKDMLELVFKMRLEFKNNETKERNNKLENALDDFLKTIKD